MDSHRPGAAGDIPVVDLVGAATARHGAAPVIWLTGRLMAVIAAAAVVSATTGCALGGFATEKLSLSARFVSVTIENRSGTELVIMFESDTLHGTSRVPASVTQTFDYEPAARGERPGGLPRPPEHWSLTLGQAVVGPTGELLGMRGPFAVVAQSEAPFTADRAVLFIRADPAGAAWRLVE